MKQNFGISALALALLPASAMAQVADTDEAEVSISGQVAPLCILGDPSPALVDLGQLISTSGTRAGKITTIINRNVSLQASFCNFAGSVVTVDVSALLSLEATAPPSGFARTVNYTASAMNWASSASVATTAALADGTSPDASGTGATQPLPNIADIGVELSGFSVPGDNLLVAGNYSGSVTVTLGPAAIVN